MLVTGILIGWGLGVAAMRAANATRNPEFLKSVYQRIQQRSGWVTSSLTTR